MWWCVDVVDNGFEISVGSTVKVRRSERETWLNLVPFLWLARGRKGGES